MDGYSLRCGDALQLLSSYILTGFLSGKTVYGRTLRRADLRHQPQRQPSSVRPQRYSMSERGDNTNPKLISRRSASIT